MDQYKLLTFTVITAAALLGASPFILDETVLDVQEQSMNASLEVLPEDELNRIGANADRNLNYGRLPLEANATKYINISSSERLIVNLDSEGNISDSLDYDRKNYFFGSKDIPVKAMARETGNYTGQVNLEITTSNNRAGDYWIRFRGDYWPFSHWAESVKSRVSSL